MKLSEKLEKILTLFDETLANIDTGFIVDEDEHGKCLSEVKIFDDNSYDIFKSIFSELEEIQKEIDK